MIGKKRSSFKRDKDEKIEMKDLFIDIGARDGEEARSLVRLGDGVVLAPQPVELRNNRVASRSFDNRVGCYVALETARRVAEAGGRAGRRRRGRGGRRRGRRLRRRAHDGVCRSTRMSRSPST